MEDSTAAHSVQTNVTAQTGGNVCAPLINRNNIHGSVTVINNIYPVQEEHSPGASAPTEELISRWKQHLKFKLKKRYKSFREGIKHNGYSTPLKNIYTELYMTEGESEDVNNEHEVRQIETSSKKRTTQEIPIKCNDIFKPLPGKEKVIRTVLTRGVAGIGKSVSVQKFILDWAEGEANQDITLIFPLPFRELNLNKNKKLSLTDLLHLIFSDVKELQLLDSDAYKIMFIFDGLDECQLPLDFHSNGSLSDVTVQASIDVLVTNLINGNLLPSALLWITTRPASAHQIPPECVDQVTEIRGFSDSQKEEYFKKRIPGQMAERIITHIKSSRSLFIMCHLPVFCWISATVLEKMLSETETGEIPKTLTQMFTHFLIFQFKQNETKYHRKCDTDGQQTRESILALGKLAFQQLEKGNLIFYEEDLRECGIDVREASVCSGVFTQMFREVFGVHLEKVFSFVHLSIQEYMAALYTFISFISWNRNVLIEQAAWSAGFFKKPAMSDLLRCAVDKALQSKNGHLDLFLRFLLGLSLESNQVLLRDLMIQTGSNFHSKEPTVKYIKQKIRENHSPEKFINLFHCLNELKDNSLVQEVQTYLRRGGDHRLSGAELSSAQWSALVFVLLNSEEELDEFDLSKYDPSEECLLRLLPVVKSCRKVVLECCDIAEEGWASLFNVLKSNPSNLRELSLNYNSPGKFGVNLLSDLLRDPHCKLEKLQLECCRITEEGCAALIKAVKSNLSHLRELNLNYNYPGNLGVKELSVVLKDPHCKLEILQLSDCSITDEGCTALIKALKSNPSFLIQLNLSNNELLESGKKQLFDLLNDPHCKMKKLHLYSCNLTEEVCAILASALSSENSSLEELDLSNNALQDSGVELLCAELKNPRCKLMSLKLRSCSIKEKGCAALASVLSLEHSSLKELDLSDNDQLQDSGMKLLSAGLENPYCKLEKLGLEYCNITDKGCADLVKALKSNPSHLIELNLSKNEVQDSGENELFGLLDDPHCKLKKLQLFGCNLTEKGCALLSSTSSNSLRELNLSDNEVLQNPGLEILSTELEEKKTQSSLYEGRLYEDWSSDEGCAALVKALKLNPPLVRVLNLNLNKLRESGVEELFDLLKNPHYKLEKLHITSMKPTRDSHQYSIKPAVSRKKLPDPVQDQHYKLKKQQFCGTSQPSREMNLNFVTIGDSGVKFLFDLLKNRNCKLEKLNLRWCNLSEKSCTVLASSLSSENSNMRELNLSKNKLQDSGIQLLSVGLQHPHCQLQKLSLCDCNLTERSCEILASTLKSNSSSLRELNLNSNKLHDLGVKLLCVGLESPHCKLEKLGLKSCSITDEGYCALAKALKSNPSSQLRELNLMANKPGESGMKQLSDLLKDPCCKLRNIE